MKYHYETVVRPEGQSFKTEEVTGPVVDCVFHVHPEPELTWVESSFGVRFVGDNIGEFHEGDLVLIGPMLPHHYVNSPRDSRGPTWSRLKVVKFGAEFMSMLSMRDFAPLLKMFEASSSGIVFPQSIAQDVAPLLNETFTARSPLRMVRMLDMLAHLSGSAYKCLSTAGPLNDIPDERMSRVLNHIRTCLENEQAPSLDDSAKVACLTPQAFSRYFRKGTRKRFTDYVTELRIVRACGLLTNSDDSILNICLSSGFHNLSNFNRHFYRLKKLTPRQYRKAFQNQAVGH